VVIAVVGAITIIMRMLSKKSVLTRQQL